MKMVSLIVTYNRCKKLQTTLEATLALAFDAVVVVNNHSDDGTAEFLNAQHDPRLYIINADSNQGGAAGFALGAEFIAQNLQTDWVVFYDDDAFPDNDFIDRFSEICCPEYSVYCAKVVNRQNQICKMNIPWRTHQATITHTLRYLFNPQFFLPDENQSSEVSTFSFVGCVVSFRLLKETYQLIDKDIFIYFDDVFYSFKLHSQGYKILYHPGLLVYHDIDTSSGRKIPPWKIYYLIRNMILSRYILKDNVIFSRTAISLRVFKYFILSLKENERKRSLCYIFKAVRDGVLNRRVII
ncbi:MULTISPECIES: glycosyltransferase [unclassified Tatumella]|uniref:glycosyltransferase n=1 Tax=unclassified Tatumella TaxID=2649542 RepID=UPI001BB0BB25|nr:MULTISPECIES: glycosyltransferase [unclassified Tatumella]MBS0854779.1 glycosyltransferase [Tatumella sp. JGM16]MBS0913868.1 glycosyltransferase [Tatumella sp. JGM91]